MLFHLNFKDALYLLPLIVLTVNLTIFHMGAKALGLLVENNLDFINWGMKTYLLWVLSFFGEGILKCTKQGKCDENQTCIHSSTFPDY